MSRFSEYFEPLTDEQVEELIKSYEANPIPSREAIGKDELETAFRYREALVLTGREEEAIAYGSELKTLIDRYLAFNEDKEFGLGFLADWTLYAIAITPETAEDFVCLPQYEELFSAYASLPPKTYPELERARMQLLHHYLTWRDTGGKTENLSPETQAMFADLENNLLSGIEAKVDACKSAGQFQEAYELSKALQRYYLYRKQPNDSINWMKKSMAAMEEIPDHTPMQLGDLNLEMGRIFHSYKKYEVAMRYFEKARELFEQAGDDAEMRMYQAEGWMEECRNWIG